MIVFQLKSMHLLVKLYWLITLYIFVIFIMIILSFLYMYLWYNEVIDIKYEMIKRRATIFNKIIILHCLTNLV